MAVDKKHSFTDHRLNDIDPPADKNRSYYYDTKQPGLRLQVTAAGTKSFQFQSRGKSGIQTRTLGRYPKISLSQARKQCAELQGLVNDGVDVVAEAKRTREEDTLDSLFIVWLDEHAKPHKKTWSEDEKTYNRRIKKTFGKKKVSSVTQTQVRQWHQGITKLPKVHGSGYISGTSANRALALLSTIYNKAAPDLPNPCRGVKKFRESSRDRFLQPEELASLFNALDGPETGEMFRDYVLVSLFTGARRSNVLGMRWTDISFTRKTWTIPPEDSKNSEAITVPLLNDIIELLERRKKVTSSIFVFPSKRSKTGHLVEPKKMWANLLHRAGLTGIRLHDLRRTMGSYQTMTGASSTIVGKTLGHKSPASTAVYARLNLDPVRASMENAVEAMLAAKDMPEKVIEMKKGNE